MTTTQFDFINFGANFQLFSSEFDLAYNNYYRRYKNTTLKVMVKIKIIINDNLAI